MSIRKDVYVKNADLARTCSEQLLKNLGVDNAWSMCRNNLTWTLFQTYYSELKDQVKCTYISMSNLACEMHISTSRVRELLRQIALYAGGSMYRKAAENAINRIAEMGLDLESVRIRFQIKIAQPEYIHMLKMLIITLNIR